MYLTPEDDIATLYTPEVAPAKRSAADLLLSRGKVTGEQMEQAVGVQKQTPGKPLEQVLLDMAAAAEADVAECVADVMGIPFERPAKDDIEREAFDAIAADFQKRRGVIALRFEDDGDTLVAGVADPADVFLIDEVKRLAKKNVRAVAVCQGDLTKLFEDLGGDEGGSVDVGALIEDMAEDDVEVVEEKEDDDAADLEKAGSESPVIRFVNFLIADAIKQGASDIHIEPKEKRLKIRYRIDGVLFESMSPPQHMSAAITSRLKIMGNLDIAERRLPQDGRIRAMVQGRQIDLRLSTLPIAHGEKSVIRVLDGRSINVPLEALGFSDDCMETWRHWIDQPHGIVLVTGPTGSGKTTTLYSSLRTMDGNKLNISTVEDPIEYNLPQANQVQVTDKIGMTFSAALKSLLRQDPDVVMLGEVRDAETARIAVQASLTGHLVLSTLHTNDAPSSVTRLINIGVEAYLISAAVNAILAQRLVRKVCPACKEGHEPSDEVKKLLEKAGFEGNLDGSETFKGRGCDKCRSTGYAGRSGLYELLVMDDALRDLVTRNPDVNELRKLCREAGLKTLREDGFDKVRSGATSVDEVLRVTEG
jgi:type IV pilus assembly protein PilB